MPRLFLPPVPEGPQRWGGREDVPVLAPPRPRLAPVLEPRAADGPNVPGRPVQLEVEVQQLVERVDFLEREVEGVQALQLQREAELGVRRPRVARAAVRPPPRSVWTRVVAGGAAHVALAPRVEVARSVQAKVVQVRRALPVGLGELEPREQPPVRGQRVVSSVGPRPPVAVEDAEDRAENVEDGVQDAQAARWLPVVVHHHRASAEQLGQVVAEREEGAVAPPEADPGRRARAIGGGVAPSYTDWG